MYSQRISGNQWRRKNDTIRTINVDDPENSEPTSSVPEFFETKEFILACNSSYSVQLQINDSPYLWLVDTGATISAIKFRYIVEQGIQIHNKTTTINGIGGSVQAI